MTDAARCTTGEWVEVERVLLEPADRSANLPPETAEKPMLVWVNGFAQRRGGYRRGGHGRDDDRARS